MIDEAALAHARRCAPEALAALRAERAAQALEGEQMAQGLPTPDLTHPDANPRFRTPGIDLPPLPSE